MIKMTNILIYLLLLLTLLFNCSWDTAGGGVIVTNPTVFGTVRFPDGKGVNEAMVIIGKENAFGPGDTSIEIEDGEISLTLNLKRFDTAYCDLQGNFFFSNISPGNNILVAQRKEIGMMTMKSVNCNFSDSLVVDLTLEPAATISIEPYYIDSIIDNNFAAAQIAGTAFTAKSEDSSGIIKFDMVPAGVLKLILFRKNNKTECYNNFISISGEKSILKVNPGRNSTYWTAINSGPRDPLGRPYILSSFPNDSAIEGTAKTTRSDDYDIEIQFSHPMDSKITNSAMKVISSDGLTSLDTVWWQGGNWAFLKLCTKSISGDCIRGDSLYRSGVAYSVIIDTIAETSLGVRFAFPDTLTFVYKQ